MTINDQLNHTLYNLVAAIPNNTREDPYSSHTWSANQLLKEGRFAEPVDNPLMKDASKSARMIMTTGVLASHFNGMVIGKRTKKLFGSNPCDLKRDKLHGIPMEMASYCLSGVLYIFGKFKETDTPRKSWESFTGWEHFVDHSETFELLSPQDMVRDSESSQMKYGWDKVWKPDDNLAKAAVESVKTGDRFSMFTYPVVNLDKTDDQVLQEITDSPGGPNQHHYDKPRPLVEAVSLFNSTHYCLVTSSVF